MEFDEKLKKEDEYRSGQPALLFKAELEVIPDFEVEPELAGMTLLDQENKVMIKPLQGITTATEIFDEISIKVKKPKPRIFCTCFLRPLSSYFAGNPCIRETF